MNFSDMVPDESGLLLGLRCKNTFNEQIFANITDYLNKHLPEWKANGSIPISDAVSIFNMIDDLSGGNRFLSEEAVLRVGDAALEIQDMIATLET